MTQQKWVRFFCILLHFLILPTISSAAQLDSLPKGFVYLDKIDPSIKQRLLFATPDNLVGVPLDGYEKGRVVCTHETALALKEAQKELKVRGLCLRVDDAYRPTQAVGHIKRWAKDLTDQKTKQKYYPNIDKKELSGKFIAANKSPHSRGSAVDVTLVNCMTEEELDFGPQTLGEESSPHAANVTLQQKQNRLLLRDVMIRNGFKPYDKEWWHFTLKNEPFPQTYFNFPIR